MMPAIHGGHTLVMPYWSGRLDEFFVLLGVGFVIGAFLFWWFMGGR